MIFRKLLVVLHSLNTGLQICILSLGFSTMLLFLLMHRDGALIFPPEYKHITEQGLAFLFFLTLIPLICTILIASLTMNQFRLAFFTSFFIGYFWLAPEALTSTFTLLFASNPIKNVFIIKSAYCGKASRKSKIDMMHVWLYDLRTHDLTVFRYRDDNCVGKNPSIDFSDNLKGQQVWLIGRGWKFGEYYTELETPNGTVSLFSGWNRNAMPKITPSKNRP